MTAVSAWIGRQRAAARALLATAEGRRTALFWALGLVGWVLIALNYPFGWALPDYATY